VYGDGKDTKAVSDLLCSGVDDEGSEARAVIVRSFSVENKVTVTDAPSSSTFARNELAEAIL
jgi:hypothetical protein